MKKIISCILVFVVILSFVGCSKPANNENAAEQTQKLYDDYESAYLEYAKENVSDFARGVFLCDLNADNIPELFSVEDSDRGGLVKYHRFDTAAGTLSTDGNAVTFVNISRFVDPQTFYMNATSFLGLYENKKTGSIALINSEGAADGNDILDVIEYDGKELTILMHGVDEMIGHSWPIDERRDGIMADYRLSDKTILSNVLVRGTYDGENPTADIKAALKELIAQFKKADYTIAYDEAPEGEFYCYIRNMDLEKKEMELIPTASITLDEYNKAMKSDKLVKINGEEMSIQIDEYTLKDFGIVGLHRMPDITYSFHEPSERNPESVIAGYKNNTPIKVSISDDVEIKCALCRTPALEQLCGKSNHTKEEFFDSYAKLTTLHYYRAVVKDGVLTYLQQIYTE